MDAQTVARGRGQIQLVDVRYPNEWDAGHIDGAVHIPEDDLAERAAELDRARPVVTVCRAGTRSADAAEWLRGEGFDASSLDGGMLGWKWAGLPFDGRIVEPQPPPDTSPPDVQRLATELHDVAVAIEKRFGDRRPTEPELRAFLRERMIAEGRSPEEADAFMAGLDEG